MVFQPQWWCQIRGVIPKMWLSHQTNRGKARRDEKQALILAEIIQNWLPNFPFSADELKMFPKSMIDDLPIGF